MCSVAQLATLARGRRPARPCLKLRHGIPATGIPGMAAAQAAQGQPGAAHSAMPLYGLHCIARAGGRKPALVAQHRREEKPVCAQARQQNPPHAQTPAAGAIGPGAMAGADCASDCDVFWAAAGTGPCPPATAAASGLARCVRNCSSRLSASRRNCCLSSPQATALGGGRGAFKRNSTSTVRARTKGSSAAAAQRADSRSTRLTTLRATARRAWRRETVMPKRSPAWRAGAGVGLTGGWTKALRANQRRAARHWARGGTKAANSGERSKR